MRNFTLASIFTLALAGFTLCTPAKAAAVEAEGKVFYKLPDGTVTIRDATLVVPEKGQGDLVLKSGDKETKAHARSSRQQSGRTIFYVVFLDAPGAPANTATIFKGTYTRGVDAAVYYGDFFTKPYSNPEELAHAAEAGTEDGFTYQGGFMFAASITPPAPAH
jgi:hypothetical protein